MDAFENVKEFSPPHHQEEQLNEEEDEEDDTDDDDEDEEEEESGEDDDDEELGEDEEWVTDDEDGEDSQDVTLITSDDDGEGGESCPICLNKFRDQDIGTPESCDHCFCLECIQEWANNVNTCPVDRQVFHLILAKHAYGDRVYKKIPVEDRKIEDEDDEDPTYCEICGRCDREDRLLLCDGCDQGYHCECLTPPLQDIPVEEWFCPDCAQTETEAVTVNDDDEIAEIISENAEALPSLRPQRRLIARTRASERVREQIIELRLQRADREARSTRRRTILLSDDEDEPQAESSVQPSTSTTPKKTPTKRKTKTKRKTPKKRKTTKGAKKTPGKGKRKRRRKRKKVTKTSKRKAQIKKLVGKMVSREVRREVQPATVKSRIAKNLGLSKPPTGTTIPLQKMPSEKGLDTARSSVGITTLSVMGDKNELIDFSDEPGDLIPSVSKPSKKSKYSTLALFSHRPVGKPVIKIDESPAASSGSAGFDLLGSIMNNQEMLGKDSSDVTIHRDGSLSKKVESNPVRKSPNQLLTSPKSKVQLYDDLPPLEVPDITADLPSPEKETQTTGTNQISDESMKEIRYLDREVDTGLSPEKRSELSVVTNDVLESVKDVSDQAESADSKPVLDTESNIENNASCESTENNDKNSINNDNIHSDQIDHVSACSDKILDNNSDENSANISDTQDENSDSISGNNKDIQKQDSDEISANINDINTNQTNLLTPEGSSNENSKRDSIYCGDENSSSDKHKDSSHESRKADNVNSRGKKVSKSLEKNNSKTSEKDISKSKNIPPKTTVIASQLDDISDESNGFNEYLEEKELEEKLQLAQEKLRKLESKGKKEKKESTKEKKKQTVKEKRSEKETSNKDKNPETDTRKEKTEKVKKKTKESNKGEKKESKKTKDVVNEKTKEKKSRTSKEEEDVMITTPPPQEIEIIEIPDDDDESDYIQNLDKKIIKSYSGESPRKGKGRQNVDLKSVVKKEKSEKEEKENRKRRESDRDHESDRKKKKKYRSRSRSRERRHRSRSYERSHRSRSRDRHKRRSRSRSRERSRRSRSRNRWSRDRSRDCSRDWSRDRSRGRDRSRDRERSRDRNRSRDMDRSRSKDRSRKRRHRDRSKDRSLSRDRARVRDTSRERRRDDSPQGSLNISTLDSGRHDTGRLIDLFDDKWKKREDLKKSKKKKKDKVRESPVKVVQSPLKRTLEEVSNDNDQTVTKKSKTPVKEKTPEPIETVQQIPKIMHVFPEKEKEIDMFADDNSDMDTDIPEPSQDTVIIINTVDNINKVNSQRPNLVSLPVASDDNKGDNKNPEMVGQEDNTEVKPVNDGGEKKAVASPEYDPAFPTDDMEESPLLDEKSPPGTPVEYTTPLSGLPLIAGEPPQLVTVSQPLDDMFPDRVSPLNQLPPHLGKGLLGEGGPLMLQRGEAPIIPPQDVPVGLRFIQGIRPGMSPQRPMLMNPLLMNRPPQLQHRFARLPPGHLPQFGLQVTTQEGVALPGQFPPGMAPGRMPHPQPGLINGNFEGLQPDTSQPPPPFQLLAGGGNHRLPGDPRLHLPPHVLGHGPPSAGAPLQLQPGPGMEQRVSIPSPLVSVSGSLMEGPHLALQGPPPISLTGPLPRLALPNHPLSVQSSQIRIPSPDTALGNPLTKLPTLMPRLQIPASIAHVSLESAGLLERPFTPPTPTSDEMPFMSQSFETSTANKLSRSQSPQTMSNISILGGKPLMSINLKASKTLQNVNPLLSGTTTVRGNMDEYPSPDENEGDDIIKEGNKSSDNVPQSTQLTQLTKLLNAQAQLAQLVSKSKTAKPSSKSGHHKSNDHKFKVPLPPRSKTSNGKVKAGESVDVIDMDVASPLDESSIEIPDSPDNFDKAVFGSKEKENKKKRRDKHDRKEHRHRDRKSKAASSHVKQGGKKPVMSVNDENLKDVIRELEMDEVPSSAVELTNKEKFLKKLHLQERVVDEVKHALKPFYSQRKINKDQYKEIMRKAVPKVCHSKSGDINPQKIASLVEAYVGKYTKKHKKGESS